VQVSCVHKGVRSCLAKGCLTVLTDLLFRSCPAIENQCAPREFPAMSFSVNPAAPASTSATSLDACSPNGCKSFCMRSLVKVRTNHRRPSQSRIRVFSLKVRELGKCSWARGCSGLTAYKESGQNLPNGSQRCRNSIALLASSPP
jgi:hypothetical protein